MNDFTTQLRVIAFLKDSFESTYYFKNFFNYNNTFKNTGVYDFIYMPLTIFNSKKYINQLLHIKYERNTLNKEKSISN